MNEPKRTRLPIMHYDVRVTVICDANASAAHAEATRIDLDTAQILVFHGTGSAKREPGDRGNDNIATDIAMGRALVDLGIKIQNSGAEQVEEAIRAARAATVARIARSLPRRPRLMPLDKIYRKHGLQAALRAARRRGNDHWEPPADDNHGRHEKRPIIPGPIAGSGQHQRPR